MSMDAKLIQGGNYQDARGQLSFCNDFDMSEVRRFYMVENANTSVIRAWQGHQKEQKWFYVLSGSFLIALVRPDNWSNPDPGLAATTYTLSAGTQSILHIPGGYANGFKALEPNARMMVFSDFTMEQAPSDNYRFDSNLWFNFNI